MQCYRLPLALIANSAPFNHIYDGKDVNLVIKKGFSMHIYHPMQKLWLGPNDAAIVGALFSDMNSSGSVCPMKRQSRPIFNEELSTLIIQYGRGEEEGPLDEHYQLHLHCPISWLESNLLYINDEAISILVRGTTQQFYYPMLLMLLRGAGIIKSDDPVAILSKELGMRFLDSRIPNKIYAFPLGLPQKNLKLIDQFQRSEYIGQQSQPYHQRVTVSQEKLRELWDILKSRLHRDILITVWWINNNVPFRRGAIQWSIFLHELANSEIPKDDGLRFEYFPSRGRGSTVRIVNI